jgi:Ca2+/Na+ antiporter
MLISGENVPTGGDITLSAIILFASVILLLLLLLVSKWRVGKLTGFILIGIYLFYVIREILLI